MEELRRVEDGSSICQASETMAERPELDAYSRWVFEKRGKIGIGDSLFVVKLKNSSNSDYYGTPNLFFTYCSNNALYRLISSLC